MDFEVKDFSPRRVKVVIVSARSTVQAPALAPECRVAEEVDVKVPCDVGVGGHRMWQRFPLRIVAGPKKYPKCVATEGT